MKNILKKLFSIFVLGFLISVSSANCAENSEQLYKSECPSPQECKKIQDGAKNSLDNKKCEECILEDDEYCVYNQCYFDKQYRLLKTELSPDKNQENCLDNIYLNFKQDLEIQCDRYSKEKNKLLDMISKDDKFLKEQKQIVKYIQHDIKEKYKDYQRDTNEVLNTCQKKIFKKFKRKQNKKIKQIKKYGAIYKFPCS